MKPLSCRYFLKRLRWEAHVQIRKGDQFVDEKWIQLHDVQGEIKQIESQGQGVHDFHFFSELEKHNTSANHQSASYKGDVKLLLDDPESLILILDFTKFNQVGYRVP